MLDSRDWSLDYFNGIFFQQDPGGTGDDATNPRYVDAYLFINQSKHTGNKYTDNNSTVILSICHIYNFYFFFG